MSLETRITALATSIAASINTAKSERGTLASLTTTNKSSLVAAANELKALYDAIDAATINDASEASATETWSINKIKSSLATAISDLVAGAPGLLDTLDELAAALGDNPDVITNLLAAQALRVRVDAATSYTAPQMAQGRDNIGAQEAAAIGNTDRDFAADFTGALT
jgi:uncharacterized phage infection (PIP) family protein YhgE